MHQEGRMQILVYFVFTMFIILSPCRSRVLRPKATDQGKHPKFDGNCNKSTIPKELSKAKSADGLVKATQALNGKSHQSNKSSVHESQPAKHGESSFNVEMHEKKSSGTGMHVSRHGKTHQSKRVRNQKSLKVNPKTSVVMTRKSKGKSVRQGNGGNDYDDFDNTGFHVDYSQPKTHPPKNN